jgi:hypothetical protein
MRKQSCSLEEPMMRQRALLRDGLPILVSIAFNDGGTNIPALSLPRREPVAAKDPTNVATPYCTRTY